jgi:predicted GNAT family acetyltransferase
LVYTLPEYRGRGYGAMLCEEIQGRSKELGTKQLYLFTHTAESLYKRLGWEELERIALKGKDIAVMKKEL